MWKLRAGSGEDGQATVELVAVLPVLGLVALLAWQAVVAGQTWWLAGVAAREGARAAALGGDGAAAARRVLPGAQLVRSGGGGVRVRAAVPPVFAGLRFGSVTVRARMEPQS
jgi:pilus assembly protein CpaE